MQMGYTMEFSDEAYDYCYESDNGLDTDCINVFNEKAVWNKAKFHHNMPHDTVDHHKRKNEFRKISHNKNAGAKTLKQNSMNKYYEKYLH